MAPAKLLHLLRTAIAHHDAGRYADAEKLYAQARAAAPFNFDVFHLSGWLAFQQKRLLDAVNYLERAAKLNPKSGLCALRFAHALKKVGRMQEAKAAAERAAELEPQNADAHFTVGELAGAIQGFDAAVPSFRRVVELQPNAADGWANLGVALAQSGAREEALACFERALSLNPADPQALTGRALVLQETHRPAEAVEAYAQVLRHDPKRHEARSARLLSLHYLDGITREQMFEEHKAFGAMVGAPNARMTWPENSPDPDRRLRVAFLSPDFRAHPVAYFIEPILAYLDRTQFEIVLYYDHPCIDVVSERFRGCAARWRHIAGQPDAAVEPLIRADAPDILVDLAGHTGRNRLPLLARRLAPVQITYLGYPDTTGVPAIDYRFVDAISDPPGEADAYASEKLVRFAPCAWTYAPPADPPDVAPPPCANGGPVTFGSFNNLAKVSDTTLRLWAGVLNAVPDSRLLVKAPGLDSIALQARLKVRMEAAGLDSGRVEMIGRVPGMASHLAVYNRVDIALDTFPYNGTTTTCDALWMGVPVITLCGDHHMSRVGASLLKAAGRPAWAARTPDEYVAIANRLGSEVRRLADVRLPLRTNLRGSRLLDHAGQAGCFGTALRSSWQTRCGVRAKTDLSLSS